MNGGNGGYNTKSDKTWIKSLDQATQFLTDNAPSDSYYLTKYKAVERNFWGGIPEWMANIKGVNSVLDIGCAYGTLSLYAHLLYGCSVDVIDFYPANYIKPISEQYPVNFYPLNIELDGFMGNAPYDVIILTEVLEHFNFHPFPTMHKIYGLLKKDGIVMLSTPNANVYGHEGPYTHYTDMPMPDKKAKIKDAHLHTYEQAELRALFAETGFSIKKFELTFKDRHVCALLEKV